MSETWAKVRLGDAIRVQYGKALPADRRDEAEVTPVVGSAGRMTGTQSKLVDGPVIVIGRKGSVGSVHLCPDGAWPLDTTYYARVPETLEPRFLAHQLHALELHRLDSSTAVPSLRRQSLEAQEILVPSIDQQRRIVEILEGHLSRLDAGERSLKFAAKRGELLELAALDALVPDGTPSVSLKEIAFAAGYGTSTKCVVDGLGVPVVRIPNVVHGAIDLSDEKRAEDPRVDLSGLMLREGDLLIVRTNGSRELIGRTAVVQLGIEASFASYLIRYQLDSERAEASWVQYMMRRPQARVEIERLASSSAGQYNLSLAKLDKVQVPLPDLPTQRELIAAYESNLDRPRRLVAVAERAGHRAARLRRALMAAAFSGKLTGMVSDVERVEEIAGV